MKNSSWIDISQPLTNSMGHWPQDTPFSYRLTYTKEQTGSVNIGRITTSLHTGTHADAPFHFDDDGERIHELDINVYIGEARVIDVSQYSSIGKKELEEIDVRGVQRLLLRTTTSTNPEVFPDEITFLRKDLGPFLKEKNIFLVGVDVPSVDPLTSKTVEAHHSLHKNGVHILENLVLSDIEPGNYELIALPLPIQQADGSPVRAVIRPLQKSNR
ncbi:arylformamidase [Alteribacillus iranensis]|uniref:Kynurenine formamidase n=1 Tax=Alteribacillus iranensis TaxID=930128 RepID=A0A1I2E051_9BACI|nr:arylformamidase [Alteribacillus iranensis]SFE86244.1 Kynurenine formamidase [Alteribacillus iranensis]